MKQNSRVRDVVLNLVGTVIGAGIFGLPPVMAKTGILGGTILFFGILLVGLSLHLLYVQVVLADKAKRRLAGYAEHWVGHWAKWFAFVVFFLKCSGAILAYIILGGEFLSIIARGFGLDLNLWIWQLIFWAVGAFIVFFGLKIVTFVEDELTWILISAMLFSMVVLFPFFDWQSIAMWQPLGFWQALGVMFFAVTAMTIIPEAVEIGGRNAKIANSGIFWGTIISGILSWGFGLTIALAYPQITSSKDIGLAFPPIFWWLIPVIGILAVITSYITITQAVKNLWHWDAKANPVVSWIIAIAFPLLLFAVTSRNFLDTIGFVGGVLTGLSGLIICLCAWFAMRRRGARIHWVWKWAPLPLALLLLVVVLQELAVYVRI
ncbi:MAG: aromatic amino acid transport family protein [Patescibacteria group bacterium]|jgi:tyrosine-specific transport protein